MSPPTDISVVRIASMTITSPGPACSKATYSADCSPGGLSATPSGRAGTKRTVTALATSLAPGFMLFRLGMKV